MTKYTSKAYAAFVKDFNDEHPLQMDHFDEFEVRPSAVLKFKRDKVDGRKL